MNKEKIKYQRKKSNNPKIISIKNNSIKQFNAAKSRLDAAMKHLKECRKAELNDINRTIIKGTPLNESKKVLVKKGTTYIKKDIENRW